MNPKYFGDSYDIVKRFFCAELSTLGYSLAIDPMLTGPWNDTERAFYRFIGANPAQTEGTRTAIFFDPDTGVSQRESAQHLSLERLAQATRRYGLAFSFDQSFSRQHSPADVMQQKLAALRSLGAFGMYYDSHARFLFAASSPEPLVRLKDHLADLGLPESRLLANVT